MTTDIMPATGLKNYKPSGLNLSVIYWTPSHIDESKRLVYIDIKTVEHTNEETGETKALSTLILADPETKEVIHQASARLVGIFQREQPDPGTPFEIVYKGKMKNQTNSYQSDSWAVYRLVPNDK
jgi:hypothetical protein